MKKRLLSALLAVVMVLVMLPFAALAEETDTGAGRIMSGDGETVVLARMNDGVNNAAETYKLKSVSKVGNVVNVTISATGVKKHSNGQRDGYWVGIGISAPTGEATVKQGFGDENLTDESGLQEQHGQDGGDPCDGKEWVVDGVLKYDEPAEDTEADEYWTYYFDAKPATITGDKPYGYITVTTTGENDATETKTYKITFEVTPKDALKVEPLTGDTGLGSKSGSALGTITVGETDANNVIPVTGTSKYVTGWTNFSNDPEQQQGNYVALHLTTIEDAGAEIRVTSPSQNMVKALDGDGIWVIRLQNFGASTEVKVYASSETQKSFATYTINLSGVVRTPVDTDSKIASVEIGKAAITMSEINADNAAGEPADVTAVFPASEAENLGSLTVKLTVSENATVKTATSSPTEEGSYTQKDNEDGTVTVSGVNLSEGNDLYVMVIAQNGSKTFYKITAEPSEMDVIAPATPEREYGEYTENDVVTTAGGATKIDEESADDFKQAAFDAALKAKATLPDAETELTNAGITVEQGKTPSIIVVPSVKIEVTEYDAADGDNPGSYIVNITPVATVYATTVDEEVTSASQLKTDDENGENNAVMLDEIRLENLSKPIQVVIGVPTGIAEDGKVYVDHYSEDSLTLVKRYLEEISSNKVTIEVDSFSPFKVTKATAASLSGLTVSDGELDPAFSPEETEYTVQVENNVETITVTATPFTGVTATVKVDNEVASGPIDLDVGENTIKIVAAWSTGDEGGDHSTTYTITVTRAEAAAPDGGGDTPGGNTPGGSTNTGSGSTNTGSSSGGGGGGGGGSSGKPGTIKPAQPQTPAGSTPTPTPTGVAGFYDVAPGAWYAGAVEYVVDRGLFSGVSDGSFAPETNMTRAMMWTVLARYQGVNTNSGSGVWYAAAQAWAIEKGISDGTMADGNVSREQFVTMLWRLSGEPAAPNSADFTDGGRISAYAKAAVDWAVAQGIVNGYNDGSFRPQGSATRAEVAKMLAVYCTNAENAPAETAPETTVPDDEK